MKRHWRAGLVAAAVAGLIVSALGGGAFAASSKSSGKADTSATLRVAAPLESGGGATFDPANLSSNAANPVWQILVFGSMIYKTPDGGLAPGLATEWSAPDPQTVKLTLRKGVTFSDGEPFTATAVKDAWERMLAGPNVIHTSVDKAITGIDVDDDTHLTIHFNAPVAETAINKLLTDPYRMSVPSPNNAAAGNINQQPIGAGPYVLESRDGNQTLTFKKNPKYYDPKAVKLSGITFTNVAGGVTQVNALMSGNVDLAWALPADSLDAVANNPNLKIEYFPGAINSLVQLCTTNGVFQSKEARQAIQYAIDRKAINEAQYGGNAQEVQTALPPSHPYWEKKLNSTYKYDPKKAKALLKKAGVAPGTKVSALVQTGPAFQAVSQVVQANLKEVGLDMEITETTNVIGESARIKPDIGFLSAAPDYFTLFVLPGTPLNACNWESQTVTDALAVTNDTSQPPAKIKEAWHTFSTTMLDESAKVFFATPPYNVVMAKNVEGVDVYMDVNGPMLTNAFMTAGA